MRVVHASLPHLGSPRSSWGAADGHRRCLTFTSPHRHTQRWQLGRGGHRQLSHPSHPSHHSHLTDLNSLSPHTPGGSWGAVGIAKSDDRALSLDTEWMERKKHLGEKTGSTLVIRPPCLEPEGLAVRSLSACVL